MKLTVRKILNLAALGASYECSLHNKINEDGLAKEYSELAEIISFMTPTQLETLIINERKMKK